MDWRGLALGLGVWFAIAVGVALFIGAVIKHGSRTPKPPHVVSDPPSHRMYYHDAEGARMGFMRCHCYIAQDHAEGDWPPIESAP